MIRQASSDELAEQLETARHAHSAAVTAAKSSQNAFDYDNSTSAEKTLVAARAAVDRAQLHVDRVQRLLDAARSRETEAARQAAEQRLAEIEPKLSHRAAIEATKQLDEREVVLLVQLAQLRAERVTLASDFEALGREHERLLDQVGRGSPTGVYVDGQGRTRLPPPQGWQHRSTMLSSSRIAHALVEQLRMIDRDDPRAAALAELIKSLGGDPRIASGTQKVAS